jgi:hypothetical protein
MPARSTAARMAIAPSSTADSELSAPRNFPTGVRAALTMTTSREDGMMVFTPSLLRRRAASCPLSIRLARRHWPIELHSKSPASMRCSSGWCRVARSRCPSVTSMLLAQRSVFVSAEERVAARASLARARLKLMTGSAACIFFLTLRRGKSIPSIVASQRGRNDGSAGKRNQGKATKKATHSGTRKRPRGV